MIKIKGEINKTKSQFFEKFSTIDNKPLASQRGKENYK